MMQDVTSHFNVLGRRARTKRKVTVTLTPQMYPPAAEVKDHWLFMVFRGFAVLRQKLIQRGCIPTSFCTVGTSSGLDALGAWEALPTLTDLGLTEIRADLLNIARANVSSNVEGRNRPRVKLYSGNLLDPLIKEGAKFDIIYENLPGIPSSRSGQVLRKADNLSWSFYPNGTMPPVQAAYPLLELHERFLSQATQCLTPNGSVVCSIGARVPWAEIEGIFFRNNFDVEVLAWEVKPQEQPEECLPAYASYETEHDARRFQFLRLAKARVAAEGLKISGERSATELAEALDGRLKPHRLSATDAYGVFQEQGARKSQIGHLAYLLLGTPRATR